MMPIQAENFSRKQILTNIGALFSGTVAARVLSAVGLFLMARQLGVGNFGLYISSISLAKLWSVLFSLGLDSWLLRNGQNEKRPLSVASGACLGIKFGLGGLWVIGFVIIAPFLKQTIFPKDLVVLAALSIWLDEIGNVAWSTFKSALHNRITAVLIVTPQIVLLLLIVVLVRLNIDTAQSYLIVRLFTAFVSMSVSIFLMIYFVGVSLDFAEIKFVLQDTISFAASHGLAVIYERADIIIIAAFLGNTAAGLYGPAVSLMTTLFLIPQVIYEVMLTWMSRTYVRSPSIIPRRSFQLVLASAVLGIGLSIGMVLIAHPLVWFIYGSEYAASGNILVILSAILIFKSISFALASVITAVGWQNKRVIVQAIVALLNIGLNILLVQPFGLTGVAYVYIISESVLMLGYMAYVLKWQQKGQHLTTGKV